MIHYSSVSAFDAHNSGLLAAIRQRNDDVAPPDSLRSEEERLAWKDGVEEGCAIRHAFDLADD
ncbi:hypothetical protein VVD49_13640 [Uliginosibacterium sp. H3]|uniref:Uncharacterized protein n=1 Tax=Uliginosibacterium silvisoli TaxID=3114758 RepID=A0ABU6K544_9RHOO|nr:hypothetical protein [Uliginosibacterium sp. H3]